MNDTAYVLVTPARNEEAFIQNTIDAVVAQTVLPRKWVIVSDGSVDRTDEIVSSNARRHEFITFVRAEGSSKRSERDFGAKVRAFCVGYEHLRGTPYQFIGNLDADVTFGPSYFHDILSKFQCHPKLGLAGGIVLEPRKVGFEPQRTRLNSVCGAVQLFRRECYEAFGGYIPLRGGGVDAAAEILARKCGWLVRVFPEVQVRAQRRVITGGSTVLHTHYRRGVANYSLGYHPMFQLASSFLRIGEKPYVVGSASTLLGYGWSLLTGRKRELPNEAVRFLQSEQLQSLLGVARRVMVWRSRQES